MLIAIIVIESVILILTVFILIKILEMNPIELAKKIMTNESADEISQSVIDDLISYCKEKGIEDVFVDTSGDRMRLAYKKGDDVVDLIELSFPLTGKGTSEYLSNVEYQKEQIDEFLKGESSNDKA